MDITKAMMHLVDLGVKSIIVNYSGSGDSGQIDEILFQDSEDNETTQEVYSDVRDIIEKRSYDLLNPIEDWYNNEGGYGQIVIQVPSGEYTIENNIYITETETYNHEGQLTDKG